jgi:hypothetical protein
MKRSGKILTAALCIAVALVTLTPASAQSGYGSLVLKPGTFDPLAYFRPMANNGGPGLPGFGFDPFNPFIYGSIWNPLSFLGPRNLPDVSIPASTKNESKGNETGNKSSETTVQSLKTLL